MAYEWENDYLRRGLSQRVDTRVMRMDMAVVVYGLTLESQGRRRQRQVERT